MDRFDRALVVVVLLGGLVLAVGLASLQMLSLGRRVGAEGPAVRGPQPRRTGRPASPTSPGPAAKRPVWAQLLARPGLPNLHRVSDSLYRGGQPTAAGMRQLVQMGVKTVVNLRSVHSDRDEIGDLPLHYEHIIMTPLGVSDADVVRFLKIATDARHTPVFVHCLHGADRTGVMCAAYRIAVQGWSPQEAIEEMTQGGFGHHTVFGHLADYLRRADFETIRRLAGLPESPGGPATH